MSPATANLHRRSARIVKALRLITALDEMREREGATPEQMLEFASGLTDKRWNALARLAGVKDPSAQTQREVLDRLHDRIGDRRRIQRDLDQYLAETV